MDAIEGTDTRARRLYHIKAGGFRDAEHNWRHPGFLRESRRPLQIFARVAKADKKKAHRDCSRWAALPTDLVFLYGDSFKRFGAACHVAAQQICA